MIAIILAPHAGLNFAKAHTQAQSAVSKSIQILIK
jgi:hypothetical protein